VKPRSHRGFYITSAVVSACARTAVTRVGSALREHNTSALRREKSARHRHVKHRSSAVNILIESLDARTGRVLLPMRTEQELQGVGKRRSRGKRAGTCSRETYTTGRKTFYAGKEIKKKKKEKKERTVLTRTRHSQVPSPLVKLATARRR
jgi:hypothetical protein